MDVALHPDVNKTEYGFILRDHHGRQLGAQSHSSFGLQDPTVAEGIGLREALSWLKLHKISHVDVEIDSLTVASFFQHH